jgi:large subunit ribosomal protein L29
MKASERLKKIRDMSVDELKNRDVEITEQMFKLRFQMAMGQTESLKKIRELRKDRARLLTVLREKE